MNPLNIKFFALIKNMKALGDLSKLKATSMDFTGVYMEEMWLDGKVKVIPAIASVGFSADELVLNCQCDANLLINADGSFDYVLFDQDPSAVSNNMWVSAITVEGVEDLDGHENTLEFLKLIPLLHPKHYYDEFKKIAEETFLEKTKESH